MNLKKICFFFAFRDMAQATLRFGQLRRLVTQQPTIRRCINTSRYTRVTVHSMRIAMSVKVMASLAYLNYVD